MIASHNFYDCDKQKAADLLSQIGIVVCGRYRNGRIQLFSRFYQKFSVLFKSHISYCRLLQAAGPPAKQIQINKVPICKVRDAIVLLSHETIFD